MTVADDGALEARESGADDGTSDTDSTYSEELMSTASLRSSIYDYEVENGRTWKYVMPNDDGEQSRMDIHYHSLRLAMANKPFIAPIENPLSILDVGTGTGIWATDVADDYPSASVLGIDLSPIQPTLVPPNLSFEVMDADEAWDLPARFDLVHSRLMNGFSIRSWPHFYTQAFESLRPGGWVENQEFDLNFTSDDDTIPKNSSVKYWEQLWEDGVQKMGLTGRCHPEVMKRQMEEAGFINCSITPYRLPVGPWPKDRRLRESGLYFLIGVLDGLSGLSVRVFTQLLGWSEDEMEALLALVRREWKLKSVHSYCPV